MIQTILKIIVSIFISMSFLSLLSIVACVAFGLGTLIVWCSLAGLMSVIIGLIISIWIDGI